MTATPMEESVRQSDFIFNGTVQQLGETTLATLEATDRTAIVRVDEVVRAPAAFAGLAGQDITVNLRDPTSVQEGEQATFFATGLLFGESIAVQEVDHRPIEPRAAELSGQVADALDRIEGEELQARAASAEVVVAGRVADVRPSPATAQADPGQPGPPSEHDPQWMEAVIDVEDVLKGEAPQSPMIVLFPSSIDVMWVNAPKFHAGQQGVWFLRTEQVPRAATEIFPSVYTVLDPTDFQPKERAERVRSLLEGSGG